MKIPIELYKRVWSKVYDVPLNKYYDGFRFGESPDITLLSLEEWNRKVEKALKEILEEQDNDA